MNTLKIKCIDNTTKGEINFRCRHQCDLISKQIMSHIKSTFLYFGTCFVNGYSFSITFISSDTLFKYIDVIT